MSNVTRQMTEVEIALNHFQVEGVEATHAAVSLYTLMLETESHLDATAGDIMREIALVMEVREYINQASTSISDAQAKLRGLYDLRREREG